MRMTSTRRERWSELWRGKLLRSMATLVSGTLLAQAISLGITPVLSRIYAPEDFGALGLLNSTSMLLVGVAALRYDMAIVLPRDPARAADVTRLSLLTVAATGTLALVAVALARGPIARSLGFESLAEWLWMAPVIVITTAGYNVLNYWCTRQQRFRRLSIASVVSAAASAGGKAAAGLGGAGAAGLVGGQVAGQLVAGLVLAAQVWVEDGKTLLRGGSWPALRAAAREYADFPAYQAPMTLLNGLAQHLPVYVLGALFGTEPVGHWALTVALVSAPVFLVTNAVRQVLFQRASEMVHAGQPIGPLVARWSAGLLALAAIPSALGAWACPWLFTVVLGAAWEPAGHFARFVVPWQLTVLGSIPAVAVFPVLRAQRVVFAWQVLGLGVSAGALVLGARAGAGVSVAGYCGAMAALNLVLIALVWWSADRRISGGSEDRGSSEDADGGGEMRKDALADERRRE